VSEVRMTTNYDMFKFREDNRQTITQSHVRRLAESIKSRNLLELRPISVNGEMEVIDGQHRLLAAKSLGVPIYYHQNHELLASDIILMNVAQAWGQADYLNYFCKNNYPEYLKLRDFMKAHNITIKIALNITMGQRKDAFIKFKQGEFKFNQEDFANHIDICWNTIDYIKRMNGYSAYTHSARFWSALLIMIRHASFDATKWLDNLKRMVERFTAKARQDDYLRLFMDVHNWRNNNKVDLVKHGE